MPELRYQRLTRARARNFFSVAFMSRTSLWLGDDHLLCVDNNGYSESYKRFYFRDIQAITIRETNRRNIWNAILLLPTVICIVGLLICLLPSPNVGGVIVWTIFALLFGVPFLVNNLRGPTCACQLRTAVQVEDLPSLCRVRQTRKVLAKIRPLITAAQGGDLTPEAVSALMRESILDSAPPVQSQEQQAGAPQQPELG